MAYMYAIHVAVMFTRAYQYAIHVSSLFTCAYMYAHSCTQYQYAIHVAIMFTHAYRYCVRVCACIPSRKEAWRTMTSYAVAGKKLVLEKGGNGGQ